jgi:hypothetical protein
LFVNTGTLKLIVNAEGEREIAYPNHKKRGAENNFSAPLFPMNVEITLSEFKRHFLRPAFPVPAQSAL